MKASNRKSEIKERLLRKLQERHPIKLCLVMIVKNESKNIPRLLETLKDIIDCISVVDTGSTDNTEEVMTEWAKRNGIPCKIHHEPFRDFGYNRTHSFEMAKKSFPECPYFLLSDADFIWEDNGFDKNKLCQPFYYVEQYNSVLSYWNIRIIASKYSWVVKVLPMNTGITRMSLITGQTGSQNCEYMTWKTEDARRINLVAMRPC